MLHCAVCPSQPSCSPSCAPFATALRPSRCDTLSVSLACYANPTWHVDQLAPSTRHVTPLARKSRCRNPGLVIKVKWSKTMQTMDNQHLLPLPAVKGHPADPLAAYEQLLTAVPTQSAKQPTTPALELLSSPPICWPHPSPSSSAY